MGKYLGLFIRGIAILVVLTTIFVVMDGIAAAGKKIQIRFETSVYVEAPHKKALDLLEQAYEKENPDVDIVIYGAPYAQFWDKLTTEILAGTEADIIQVYPENIAQYAALKPGEGAFVNLDDKISGTELEKLIGQKINRYKGHYVALSNYAWGVTGMFYRKSLLKDAGINPENLKTLQDWAEAAAKLTKDLDGDGKIDQYGFGIVLGTHPFVASEWYRMVARPVSGGIFFGDNEAGPYTAKRINVNHPGNVWAAKFWQDLIFNKHVTPTYTPDKKDTREYFWNGKAAFNMDGPWFIGMTREYDEKVLKDTGLMPHLPVVFNGKIYPATSGFYPLISMLSKNSKYPEEAWKFMKWMASLEAQKLVAVSGMIPSNPKYSTSEEYKTTYPLAAKFVEFMDDYVLVNDPAIPELGELTDILINSTQQMFVRNMDAKTVLDDAAKQMKAVVQP